MEILLSCATENEEKLQKIPSWRASCLYFSPNSITVIKSRRIIQTDTWHIKEDYTGGTHGTLRRKREILTQFVLKI
jgi:hypothetical protein